MNAKSSNAVVVYGQQVEDVDSFDYLGARITKHGGAFNKLVKIWIKQKHQDKNFQVQRHSSTSLQV